MIKWIILFASLLMGTQIAYAATCPSVKEIKTNHVSGWKVYDSDNGKPLSLARENTFKKMIEEFTLAEWVNNNNKLSSIHCYYRDKTGSSLEAYFAKDHFLPSLAANNFWYNVSGFMHCAAGMDKCQFESLGKTKLAKNKKSIWAWFSFKKDRK